MVPIAFPGERKKRIAGAPQVYDIEIDAYRDVTQADVDAWLQVQDAYTRVKHEVEQTYSDLQKNLLEIRRRARVD